MQRSGYVREGDASLQASRWRRGRRCASAEAQRADFFARIVGTVDPVSAEGANSPSGLKINALVEDAVVGEAGEVRALVQANLLNGNGKLLLRVYRLNLCQVTPSKLVERAVVIAGVVEIAQYEGRSSSLVCACGNLLA